MNTVYAANQLEQVVEFDIDAGDLVPTKNPSVFETRAGTERYHLNFLHKSAEAAKEESADRHRRQTTAMARGEHLVVFSTIKERTRRTEGLSREEIEKLAEQDPIRYEHWRETLEVQYERATKTKPDMATLAATLKATIVIEAALRHTDAPDFVEILDMQMKRGKAAPIPSTREKPLEP